MPRYIYGLFILIGLIFIKDESAIAQSAVSFPKSSLEIETKNRVYKFDVELAVSPQQRAYGLMYRQNMGANEGMLFHYKSPQVAVMWMKNTYIPLDMIFIRPNGVIENIIQRTVPHSEEILSATNKVRGVLELNAGVTDRLDIRAGDKVIHDIFINIDD